MRFVLFILIFLSVFRSLGCSQKPAATFEGQDAVSRVGLSGTAGHEAIYQAFLKKQSGMMVESSGTVLRVLDDDMQIPRHQRFIIRLGNGQTLLMNHNIDLALRITELKIGDPVYFRGQYEWNDKGGVIHWTHHDPKGAHPAGWIEHEGRRYE